MTRSTCLLVGTLLFAATASQASLFSLSPESRAAKRARAADRAMERAENAMDDKDYEAARKLFTEAIEYYRKADEAVPGYRDDLPAIRIRYCSEQLTNAVLAIEGAAVELVSEPSVAAEKAAAEAALAESKKAAEATAAEAAPASPDGETAAEAFARATGERQPEPLPDATAAKPAETPPPATRETGLADSVPSASSSPASEKPTAASEMADAEAPAAKSVAEKAAADEPEAAEEPAYDPRNFVHDYNEARDLLESGKAAEAASLVIPLLRHDPGNRSVRILLALIRTRQGRCEEAIVALENLRGRRDDLALLLALSAAYTGAGRYHDALLALDSAMRLSPSDPAAYLNSAWLTLIMPSSGPNTLKHAEAYYRMAIARGAARDRALERRLGLTKW